MDEDVKSGIIEVEFLQYWRGYRGDTLGTPHTGYKRPGDNNKRLETIRILNMRWIPHWNPEEEIVEGIYIPPRIHKHKLLDYWARLRNTHGKAEIEAIRNGLWGAGE
jgi:hypothetical protein